MQAKDLMQTAVVTIRSDATAAELCERMQAHHLNGMPVVDESGGLVGIVSEEDVLYGMLGLDVDDPDGSAGEIPRLALDRLKVADIMTSPAITVEGDADAVEVCRAMWGMRIHRLPVIEDGEIRGIISASDFVRAIAEGEIEL